MLLQVSMTKVKFQNYRVLLTGPRLKLNTGAELITWKQKGKSKPNFLLVQILRQHIWLILGVIMGQQSIVFFRMA
jgi:hypothetical protein